MPPARVGERLILRIQDIAFGGEGVARLGAFVVFVPFVAPGETVEAQVTEVKRHFARARLLSLLEASPDRVEPPCPYFAACGGCQYQHLAYSAQLAIKHRQVTDLVRRIGHCESVTVDPVIPCPRPFGYRNRIMVRSQWHKTTQSLVLGFRRYDGGLVVDIQNCQLAEPVLNEQLQRVRAHPPPKGGIKVLLRVAPEGWVVPKDSFFQNNLHLLDGLVDAVCRCLRDGGCRFLVDAYCGVGFFSLELAHQVDAFTGIEYDHQAVTAARHNAARRGRTNGEFLRGTVEALLPGVLARHRRNQTVVLLDPPRRGATRSTLDVIRAQRPRQILYISCQPATLARDLEILCADGAYQPVRIVPLDMFPQTQHVECVADLRAPADLGRLHFDP